MSALDAWSVSTRKSIAAVIETRRAGTTGKERVLPPLPHRAVLTPSAGWFALRTTQGSPMRTSPLSCLSSPRHCLGGAHPHARGLRTRTASRSRTKEMLGPMGARAPATEATPPRARRTPEATPGVSPSSRRRSATISLDSNRYAMTFRRDGDVITVLSVIKMVA